jgi:hypothetical protein
MSDGMLKANQHLSDGWRSSRKELDRLHKIMTACPTCKPYVIYASHLGLPDWATGPEWEGWKWHKRVQAMMRWSESTGYEITDDCELVVTRMSSELWDGSAIQGVSHATALAVANLLAESDGGWAVGEGETDVG